MLALNLPFRSLWSHACPNPSQVLAVKVRATERWRAQAQAKRKGTQTPVPLPWLLQVWHHSRCHPGQALMCYCPFRSIPVVLLA